jgi:RIO kinase 2
MPIDRNRHVLVMSLVHGSMMNRVILEHPEKTLSSILGMVRKAFSLGVIHGDLSEFNVMIGEDDAVVLIDWPQWESATHPNAVDLLRRDIANITGYFQRKYGVSRTVDAAVAEVTG